MNESNINSSEIGKTLNNLPKGTQGAIMLGAVVLMVIFLSSMGGSDSPASPAPTRIGVGDQAVLSMAGNEKTPVFASKDALDAFVKAAIANDDYGVAEVVLQGKAYLEPNGTKVRIIDSTLGKYQVRILEGDRTGMAVWVQKEFVSPVL